MSSTGAMAAQNVGVVDRSSTTSAASGTVKLTVALPEDAVNAIAAIAERQHKTKTQVLREAIALKTFIEQELSDPATRMLIERAGNMREIVFT